MVVEATPKAEVFSLKTPLLSDGRTDKVLAQTDLLELRVKVYAEGGENGLHKHNDEDHAFVILQGQATFYDESDKTTVVNPYEGIMLPRGAFYRFASTGDENLVLLRAGAGMSVVGLWRVALGKARSLGKAEGGQRVGTHGRALTREENKHIEGRPIPGSFFGGQQTN